MDARKLTIRKRREIQEGRTNWKITKSYRKAAPIQYQQAEILRTIYHIFQKNMPMEESYFIQLECSVVPP